MSPLGRRVTRSSRSTFCMSFLSSVKHSRGSYCFFIFLISGDWGLRLVSNRYLSRFSRVISSSYSICLSVGLPWSKLTRFCIAYSSLDLVTLPDDGSLLSMLLCILLFSPGSTDGCFYLARGGLPISEISCLPLKNAESPRSYFFTSSSFKQGFYSKSSSARLIPDS